MTLFCELMHTLQLLFTLSVSHFGDCRFLRSPVVIRSYGVSTATVSRGVFVSRHRASTFVITALLCRIIVYISPFSNITMNITCNSGNSFHHLGFSGLHQSVVSVISEPFPLELASGTGFSTEKRELYI